MQGTLQFLLIADLAKKIDCPDLYHSEDSYIPSSSRVSRQTASETSTRSGIPQPAFQTHGIRTPAPSAVDPQNAYKSHIVPGGADDIHMMTINPSSISPTLLEQLALHDEAVAESASTSQNVPVPSIADQRVQVDHHRNVQEDTRDRDIRMQTANRGYVPPASHAQAQRQQAYQSHQVPVQTQPLQQPQQQQPTAPPALTAWEKQILNDPDVKRKATLAQLCE